MTQKDIKCVQILPILPRALSNNNFLNESRFLRPLKNNNFVDNERKSKNNKIERYGLVKYRNVFNKCQLLESNGKKI